MFQVRIINLMVFETKPRLLSIFIAHDVCNRYMYLF